MADASAVPSRVFIDLTSALRTIFSIAFFVSTLLYYRVMAKRKVFHLNLYVILIASPLSFTVILLPNMIRDVFQWFIVLSDKTSQNIMMTVDIGQFSSGYNLLVLVTERGVATVFVTKYEHLCSTWPWFAVALCCVQWTASVILLYLNYNGEVVSSITLVISILVGCVLSATVFAFLPKISKRAYNRELHRNQGSVQRYQASENVKSAQVLQRLVLSTVASVLFMLAIYSYIRFFVDKSLKDAFFNIHFSIVAAFAIFLNLIILVSHDKLRKELIAQTRTGRWFGRKADQIVMVTSMSGQRLDVPKGEQTAAYYGYYENTWV